MPVTERHAHVTAGVVSLRGEGVADVFRRGEGPGPQLPLKPLLRHHESVLDSAIVTPRDHRSLLGAVENITGDHRQA